MDIKARIDGLTEQEAKSAIEFLVDYIAFGNRVREDSNMNIEQVRHAILSTALKEARK